MTDLTLRRARHAQIAAWTATAALVVLLPLLAWALITRSELPPDPFGAYPIQDVQLPEAEVPVHHGDGPEVATVLPWVTVLDGQIPVEGAKCIDSDGPVPVSGTVSWRQVAPVVRSFPTSSGSAIRQPGCETSLFVNDIPPVVIRAHNEADGVTVWQVTGTETTDDGARQTWATENFAIVDEAP